MKITIPIIALLCLGGCAVVHHQQVRIVPSPEDMPARGEFVSPLPGARVLSDFGPRGARKHEFHEGIDLVKSKRGGDMVYAARTGVVEMAEWHTGYGRMVLLRHADGCSTRYAHLAKIYIKKGQKVETGEKIGTVGQSGRASAPHLHYEIITRTNCPIDPRPYLNIQ